MAKAVVKLINATRGLTFSSVFVSFVLSKLEMNKLCCWSCLIFSFSHYKQIFIRAVFVISAAAVTLQRSGTAEWIISWSNSTTTTFCSTGSGNHTLNILLVLTWHVNSGLRCGGCQYYFHTEKPKTCLLAIFILQNHDIFYWCFLRQIKNFSLNFLKYL